MKTARVAAALAALMLAIVAPASGNQDAPKPPKPKKPSIGLKATPPVSFSPARIVFTVDLKGGSDNFEDFYCPSVEWDWGDGTESENTTDCEPYEAGTSKIQRHFTAEHRYETFGEYRVVFRMKRAGKVVGSATATVRVRPGLRDIG